LKKAPIREAIIDLKVSPSIDVESLEPIAEALKESFPQQEIMQQSTFGFEVSSTAMRTSRTAGRIQGRRLTSKDGKHIVQFRVDGFTFSRLPQYQTWETLRGHAEPLWQKYVQHSKPEDITRAAVRYINVMDFPIPIADLRDYLSAPPSLPASLPQELGGFFSRVTVVHREINAAAFVTQALESSLGNNVQVILDIDVFREAKNAEWKASDHGVWGELEKMRTFKNQIFFESITEKTAGLFE
jgi:uncharacterized protein (TIGR04255 family)